MVQLVSSVAVSVFPWTDLVRKGSKPPVLRINVEITDTRCSCAVLCADPGIELAEDADGWVEELDKFRSRGEHGLELCDKAEDLQHCPAVSSAALSQTVD